MTVFERVRDAFMSEWFARFTVLFLFAWVLIQWTALHDAEQRYRDYQEQLRRERAS